MTAPATPQRVIADELVNVPTDYRAAYEDRERERLTWAQDILKALTEHGYSVVATHEPQEDRDA